MGRGKQIPDSYCTPKLISYEFKLKLLKALYVLEDHIDDNLYNLGMRKKLMVRNCRRQT